jgi:hypothetical protein
MEGNPVMPIRAIVKQGSPQSVQKARNKERKTEQSRGSLRQITRFGRLVDRSKMRPADLVFLQQTAGNRAVIQADHEDEGLLSSLGGAASDFLSGGGLMHQASQSSGGWMSRLTSGDMDWGEMAGQAASAARDIISGDFSGGFGGIMGGLGDRVRGLFG